jgi:hypothetical protein
MTFEEWLSRTIPLDPAQQMVAKCAWEAGQLEAATHILELWNEPWPIRQMSFITMLREYVEELKT